VALRIAGLIAALEIARIDSFTEGIETLVRESPREPFLDGNLQPVIRAVCDGFNQLDIAVGRRQVRTPLVEISTVAPGWNSG
jgi:hypothetical protein